MINESTLDPIQETRCKDLFIGPEYKVLKSKVKNQILDILYKWLKKMGYDYEKVIKQIRIEGSSIGFQYTKTSDIDVSIISTLPNKEIDNIWKLLPNGQNVTGTTMPINYYMLRPGEEKSEDATQDMYDVLKDEWLKQSKFEEIKREVPFSYVIEIAKFFTAGVDDRINEYEADNTELKYLKSLTKAEIKPDEQKELIAQKEQEIKADLDSIYIAHCMLKSLRHQAYGKKEQPGTGWYPVIIDIKEPEEFNDPNHSIANLVYKAIEKLGYFEKLEKYEYERDKLKKD